MIRNESDIVTFNYYQYYKAFALSGIINYHEGPVSWIIPHEGEKGPSLAFDVKLDETTAEKEIKTIITGMKRLPSAPTASLLPVFTLASRMRIPRSMITIPM